MTSLVRCTEYSAQRPYRYELIATSLAMVFERLPRHRAAELRLHLTRRFLAFEDGIAACDVSLNLIEARVGAQSLAAWL
jgi:hypothetical protein